MDDLDVLARDFGLRPSGKSAPMRSDGGDRRTGSRPPSPFVDDHSYGRDSLSFNDVFGGPPKYTNSSSNTPSSTSGLDYESIFKTSTINETRKKSTSSLPVYDKPVYDEDIFDGLPGIKSKSTSTSTRFDDNVFSSTVSPPRTEYSDDFDDLLGNLGKTEKADKKTNTTTTPTDFDDLLPGFGSGNSASSERPIPASAHPQESGADLNQTTSDVMDNPFGVLGSTSAPELFSNPLEEKSKIGSSKVINSSFSGGVFDDLDPLSTLGKASPGLSSNVNSGVKDGFPPKAGSSTQTSGGNEAAVGNTSFGYSDNPSLYKVSIDNSHESYQTFFEMPNISTDSQKPFGLHAATTSNATTPLADMSPHSSEQVEPSDDVWLTVSEIQLFTQPTRAPPPSRPPPPIPRYGSKTETDSFASNSRSTYDEFSSSPNHSRYSQRSKHVHPAAKSSVVSSIDELEDFSMGRSGSIDENTVPHSSAEANADSASVMKEVVDRAEAKFRHAKEVREREQANVSVRSEEAVRLERDEEVRETQEREREKQERFEHEQRQREREEEERRRVERERERARAKEIERENARRAVERATREARERAAADARERAAAEARLKSERAAVEKANAEARERAERAAVQRVQAEARERAAAEARERAEKAAAEARERMNAEAREKEVREKAAIARAEAEARRRAERAAVEKAAAEARERAAAAAAAARNQHKNDNDLDSFFSMGRASSAPRRASNFSDPVSDMQSQSKEVPEGARRTSSSGTPSHMKKASSTSNIVDDLSSIFGAAPSSGEFQEVEGESEERRRSRLERHQRTQERAAKALAEKNLRDLQTQREQEERHRISEALDFEIRRWAAGKEGNLRALLSTLQYVLWPECGWQPVSLTDLIVGASVKKVYRKATLCIHPDKVQQKGANLQQKYIAEKVFDLLKEAWNKFNSEELF